MPRRPATLRRSRAPAPRERRPAGRGPGRPPERRQVDVPRPREPALRRDRERARAPRSPSSVAWSGPAVARRGSSTCRAPGRSTTEPAGDDPFWTLHPPGRTGRDPRRSSTPATSPATCRSPSRAATSGCRSSSRRTSPTRRPAAASRSTPGRLGQLLNAPTHATCGRTGEGVDAALADAVRLGADPAGRQGGRRCRRGRRSRRPSTPFATEQRLAAEAALLAAAPRSLGAAAMLEPLQAGVLGGLDLAARRRVASASRPTLEPARWTIAGGWAAQVEHRRDVPEPLADRLARWATSPWPGIPAFLAISLAMFLAVILRRRLAGGGPRRRVGRGRLAVPRRPRSRRSSRSPCWQARCCGRSTAGCWGCSRSASRTCSRST